MYGRNDASTLLWMNNSDPIPIHQLIQKFIVQSPHQHKMMQASVINAWNQLLPTVIHKSTKRIYVKQHKIFLEIPSSPLRHELQHAKQGILEKLQAYVPNYPITDILFI